MGPGVSIDIARKAYGADPLFRDFRLAIAPSSVVALVGRSGVGKSTLLRMIAGIDTRFAGSIRVDGVEAGAAPPAGVVFQDARLLPWLTAIENLTAMRDGLTRDAAAGLLAGVGLAGHEGDYPHQLSGGMQRRLALVRAVSMNPGFWLLDEPFVSLDRQLVGELQAQLLALVGRHAPTVILVTHRAEEAARLATRAVLLDGRPATIAADFALEGEPAGRSDAELRRLAALIEAPARSAG